MKAIMKTNILHILVIHFLRTNILLFNRLVTLSSLLDII